MWKRGNKKENERGRREGLKEKRGVKQRANGMLKPDIPKKGMGKEN